MNDIPKLTFKDRVSFSMTEARAARWEICREKGKQQFILKTGLLFWGVPMFVLTTFLLNTRFNQELTVLSVLGSAFTWAAAGIMYGWISWILTEKQYRKYNRTKSQQED